MSKTLRTRGVMSSSEGEREERTVEDDGWMSARVEVEIEDLRQTHGFDQDEATAYWHLQRAAKLMFEMSKTEISEHVAHEQGEINKELADIIHGAIIGESRIFQHFLALYRDLGARVLRRDYPTGWGKGASNEDKDD
jgi:hypothetical protein